MILFHFCRRQDVRGIRSKGITKGMIPIIDKGLTILTGWQWLTLDGERKNQSWNTHYLMRADRTEYRFTVEIPEKEESSLYDRKALWAVNPLIDKCFAGWPGSDNWRVYRGNIPRKWIKRLEHWNAERQEWEEENEKR